MIKYLIMDVDGTLTDGMVYIGENGELFKAFNIKDGYGIHDILPKISITPVIITGRKSQILLHRCNELGINEVYQGVTNKEDVLQTIICCKNSSLDECAYIGDDLNDLQCVNLIREAGGKIGCPSDAVDEIREAADFISSKAGGYGAVREFISWIAAINKIL
jgi:3-deoxy-D-manno-octulosonate 8-phosphate phosphatase (KDO 8-P phosphatase)